MSFGKFKESCRNAWQKDFENLCIDRSKKTKKNRKLNENRNTYIDCTPKSKPFQFQCCEKLQNTLLDLSGPTKVCLQLKIEKL